MTSTDRPTPPPELDDDLRAFLDALAAEDAETIRTVATYADELATWADESAADESSGGDDTLDDPPLPADVPDDASVSVEEIAGTTYYYFQWRDGDEIRSQTATRDR